MQREEGPKGLAAGLRAGEQIVEGCFRNRRYVRRCTPRETKVRLEEGPKAWAATPQQRLLHHSSMKAFGTGSGRLFSKQTKAGTQIICVPALH